MTPDRTIRKNIKLATSWCVSPEPLRVLFVSCLPVANAFSTIRSAGTTGILPVATWSVTATYRVAMMSPGAITQND